MTRLTAEIPKSTVQGTRITFPVTVKTQGRLPSNHWVRMEVIGPDREPIPYLSKTISCLSGRGDFTLSFALNETPGRYELRFRDLLSGLTATHYMTVNQNLSP